MKDIIYDLEILSSAAKPLEFITDTGMDTEYGEEIITELKETLEANPALLTLAAPQIGYNARIFCIRFNDTVKVFINPIVTKKSKFRIAAETCSAMPGKEILISRPEEVTVVYYTDEFKYEDNKLLGPAARLFDQQAQLVDGILPDTLGLVSDIELDGPLSEVSDEEFAQLLEYYKTFIESKTTAMQAAIQEETKDETINKAYKQLKFTEDVINGRTQVIANDEDAVPQLSGAAKRGVQRMRGKAEFQKFVRSKH